jgi:hypothetical protein
MIEPPHGLWTALARPLARRSARPAGGMRNPGLNGALQSNTAPPLADCEEVGASGRCFGELALWCEDGTAHTQKCEHGLSCGFSTIAKGFRCVRPEDDPCGGITDRGQCVDDDRVRCTEGHVVVDPCTACNAACQLSVRNGKAICNSTAAGSL